MYADRMPGRRFDPATLTVAVGINAAMVAALLFAGPQLGTPPPLRTLPTYAVPPDTVPPPPPPEPQPQPPRADYRSARPEVVDASRVPVATDIDPGLIVPPGPPATGDIAGTGTGEGLGGAAIDPPKPPPPVLVAPGIDPRYAADFQPTYPSDERRAGRDGKVVARVLVGVDGRVLRIERVSATSNAFWNATVERAMRRWRFRPGTSDGMPVEAWRVMTLTFVLRD